MTREITVLGRKQSLPDPEVWRQVMARVAEVFPDDRVDELVERTAAEVRQTAAGRRVAYAWSGGKDSLALDVVMRAAGIEDCVLVMSNLEYPEFLRWVTVHMPPGLTVVNTGQDVAWLRDHPHMLFPQGRWGPHWFKIVQHTGQARYFKDQNLDLIALGRRRADGNYCGRRAGENIYTSKGITRWSPLADWSHEAVLALLRRHQMVLPPCYDWPRGFQVGTGPWPARQWTTSLEHGWSEVWQIDQDVVRHAAGEAIPGAGDFLATVQ